MVLPTRIYSRIVEEEQHQICAWNLSNEHTVHDVDDEDECRLLVHRRKHDVQHPVRTVELPQAAMIASFQDESKLLLAIKAAACGVNLTAGSLADSVIRLGNGERAAAQEFFGRILPAIKDQRQECSDQRQGCSDQRQGCSGHRSKLH